MGPRSYGWSAQEGELTDSLILLGGRQGSDRHVRTSFGYGGERKAKVTLECIVYWIVMLMVTMLELTVPSFTRNRKESDPVAPAFGV